ncbi:hypothetical protein FA13DRAFT_1708841 [Coprinellus micaceus]|uniref:Uncharacterized protein n=1 Tax=Coprinellus micaceus TaxID=71717 RepID=A0A4Y7TFU0_COPMI|nr:hypothetical protein FA13DRAFT_1708841 [Coprinellus micaceus]
MENSLSGLVDSESESGSSHESEKLSPTSRDTLSDPELYELLEKGHVDAATQVLISEDILPTIFPHLHGVLEATGRWKAEFASLAVVNHVFFNTSSKVLWYMVDNLSPIFNHLPWFKQGVYQAVQTRGSGD